MPAKRSSKFVVDGQHTETKENMNEPSLRSIVAGGRMTHKRRRSDPGDTNNIASAVLRLSQESNNSGNGSHIESMNSDGDKDTDSRHVNSARLFARSLEKASARKQGKSKRIKTSSENNSAIDPFLRQERKVVTASSSAGEQSVIGEMPVNGQSVPRAATDSTVSDVT